MFSFWRWGEHDATAGFIHTNSPITHQSSLLQRRNVCIFHCVGILSHVRSVQDECFRTFIRHAKSHERVSNSAPSGLIKQLVSWAFLVLNPKSKIEVYCKLYSAVSTCRLDVGRLAAIRPVRCPKRKSHTRQCYMISTWFPPVLGLFVVRNRRLRSRYLHTRGSVSVGPPDAFLALELFSLPDFDAGFAFLEGLLASPPGRLSMRRGDGNEYAFLADWDSPEPMYHGDAF